MSEIMLLGLNYKSAPVELRECVAFTADEVNVSLKQLIKLPSVNEVVLFSTCNRTELLIFSSGVSEAVSEVKCFISSFKKVSITEFEGFLYCYTGENAVKHLFRVASSLDSMVVGESQILGQIKEAYRISTFEKTSGTILNRLLHKTFSVAKKVRTETGIGNNAVSVSYASVELAKKIFGSLKYKRVLLIGAGEMAELAVEHLLRNHVDEVFVANRTFKRGVYIAEKFRGKAIKFDEIIHYLSYVDIVISSTGATNPILCKEQVKGIVKKRRNRGLFFIDIAVPRDIDPKINDLDNIYVYDIDDLEEIVNENKEDRIQEAMKAERIVDEALIQFRRWYDTLSVVPTIIAMRSKIIEIAEHELEKTFHSLNHLPNSDKEALVRMLDSIINKILHDPTLFLKREGCLEDKSSYIDFTRKLFNLC